MSKAEVSWIFAECITDQFRNVWVMVTESQPQKGIVIRSVRVYSTEPTEAMIKWQRDLYEADESPVNIVVLPVSVDYFDDEELEAIST